METKPFFYRIVAADLVAEVLKLKDGEHKDWVVQFALDLVAGEGTTSYAKKVISEVQEYRTKQAENGRNRWKDLNKRKERVAKRALCEPQGSLEGRTGNSSSSNRNNNKKTIEVPYDEIINLYNSICVSLPHARGRTKDREKIIKARWEENKSLIIFEELFKIAENTPFLRGKNDRSWKADFDFLLTASKFNRVLEGKYGEQLCISKEVPQQPSWL
jgi:hypothetical protein